MVCKDYRIIVYVTSRLVQSIWHGLKENRNSRDFLRICLNAMKEIKMRVNKLT